MGVGVLLVGNGAREHALATALSPSARIVAYMAHENPGIAQLADTFLVGTYEDTAAIASFAKAQKVDFALIGPEGPLALGVVDALEQEGIACVGPPRRLARIESSKSFARELLERHKIPGNPKFKVFTTDEGIEQWIRQLNAYVVKADGLHAGKGVKVSGAHLRTPEEGAAYAKECLATDGKVVIEERLEGEEFSLMAWSDGTTIVNMPCVQDHKRAHEGDTGPNTGGMGSYSDANHKLPFLTDEEIAQAAAINEAVAKALSQEFGAYKGVLYGGFMATASGVKLIEYNARLGDPEAMNVLSLLETDLTALCRAIITGTLKDTPVTFRSEASVCLYIVPEGYPDAPTRGQITIAPHEGVAYYFGAIAQQDGALAMLGSRALALVARAPTIEQAQRKVHAAARDVHGKLFSRSDIGTRSLIEKRIAHMEALR